MKGRPRTRMTYKRLVSGSYQAITLRGTYLQLLKGGSGWTVSSSIRTEGPVGSMKAAKEIAASWDFVAQVEAVGRGFKLDEGEPIRERYKLTLTTIDGEVIEAIELNGEGFTLPLRFLGPESLAQEINTRLRWWEAEHPPAKEVPL